MTTIAYTSTTNRQDRDMQPHLLALGGATSDAREEATQTSRRRRVAATVVPGRATSRGVRGPGGECGSFGATTRPRQAAGLYHLVRAEPVIRAGASFSVDVANTNTGP